MTAPAAGPSLWTVPNLLTLSRLPLAAVLYVFIELRLWPAAFGVFLVAALTDAIDGWWARRFHQQSAFGRVFDPLTDKILLGGAFIFLVPVPESGMRAWMAAVVIAREMLITGVRGYVESLGHKFGADWLGKLKTVLQCVWLGAVLAFLNLRDREWAEGLVGPVEWIHLILLYAMLVATVASGVQYCWKAWPLMVKGA